MNIQCGYFYEYTVWALHTAAALAGGWLAQWMHLLSPPRLSLCHARLWSRTPSAYSIAVID
jgi:hypothetical protein